MATRVTVNSDLCLATGYCLRDLPDVFSAAPDGSAFVSDDASPLSAEHDAAAREAADRCPAGAIEVVDD